MMISQDQLKRALEEASGYSPAKATKVVRAVAEAQPELFAFVVELTEEFSDDTMSLALMMLVAILRAFELGSEEPVREIDRRTMTRTFRKTEKMLEAIIEAPEGTRLDVADPKRVRQPHLMEFVVETIMEDEDRFTPQESGTLFLVLKSVVDALDAAVSPPRKPRLKVVKGGRPPR